MDEGDVLGCPPRGVQHLVAVWNHAVGVSVGVNVCASMSTVPPTLTLTVRGNVRSAGLRCHTAPKSSVASGGAPLATVVPSLEASIVTPEQSGAHA